MKPLIIQQLEKELNTTFNKVDISKILTYKKSNTTAEYSIGQDQSITGLCIIGFNLNSIPNYLPDSLLHLNLYNNKISDISALKNLQKLTKLDLSENYIKHIPDWICNFPKMDIKFKMDMSFRDNENDFQNIIYFYGNPIESPPIEIIEQGKEAIKNYFNELEKGTVNLYETKLLFVGYGLVGKTSLMKRLVFNEYNDNEESTEGIEIKQWNLKTENNNELKINIWDFGGQEIYHSTHQFFLSKRSIYLLVWDARIDFMMPNLASFDYWLRIVSLLSQNSPILVVQNKIDERISEIDQKNLRDYFPNIVGFYKVSAKDGSGVKELQDVICKEINKLPHIGEQLPKVWIDIRNNLKQTQQNFIKLDDYLAVCKSYQIDFEQALHLSSYFHDLGTFLHFQDNDILRNLIFLNPEWATKAVYKIIDTKEVVLNKGKFNYSQLRKIWHDYPDDKFAFLIELMKKFELCFLLPNQVDYIVPGLLLPTEPGLNWDTTNNLQFEYRYVFLPAGIVTRLIVRMHDYVKNNLYWRQGVIIEREEAMSIITSDYIGRKIHIKINGKNKQDLFSIIRYEIENIHKTLKEPPAKLLTHCICPECINSEKPEFYPFEQLNKFLDKGKKTITCPKSVDEVSIPKLLGKVNGNGEQKSLFEYVLLALKQLQGLSLNIRKYEDSRNSFVANVLTNKNFRVKDQTKWGIAKTKPGEIDIKIEDEKGNAFAICEAFNLEYLDKNKIENHLTKIFNYDVNGLLENYLITYCNKNFMENWKKYIEFIPTIDYIHKLTNFTDISNNADIPANIKVAIAEHNRNERISKIYHLFVQMEITD